MPTSTVRPACCTAVSSVKKSLVCRGCSKRTRSRVSPASLQSAATKFRLATSIPTITRFSADISERTLSTGTCWTSNERYRIFCAIGDDLLHDPATAGLSRRPRYCYSGLGALGALAVLSGRSALEVEEDRAGLLA